MRTKTVITALAMTGLLATPAWSKDQIRYVYKGEGSAEAVCMSIVRDSVPGVRRALRQGRTQRLERSHLVYECNRMALDEFAFTVNAVEVSTYLAPMFGNDGRVTIEQVGSIQD